MQFNFKKQSFLTTRLFLVGVGIALVGYGAWEFLPTQFKEHSKGFPKKILNGKYDDGGSLIATPRKLSENEKLQEALFYYSLGQMASYQGNSTEAIEYYKEALKLDPAAGYVHTKIAEEYLKKSELELSKNHL